MQQCKQQAHSGTNSAVPCYGISYDKAVQALDQHAQWWRTLTRDNQGSFGTDDRPTSFVTTTVAYLCDNSLDFALSILAATSSCACASTTCHTTPPKEEVHHHLRLLPALLNTRWSVADMVAALRPAAGGSLRIVYGEAWRARARQLQGMLQDKCGCCSLAALPDFGDRAIAPLEPLSATPDPETSRRSALPPAAVSTMDAFIARACPADALLVFTSGTTAAAKGVRLSHRALGVQARAKVGQGSPCAYDCHTRVLANTVPFFHVGGLGSLLAVWMAGGCLVAPPPHSAPRAFEAHTMWESLDMGDAAPNSLVVVPAMVHALQQSRGGGTARSRSYPHVVLVLVGGQSLSAAQQTFLRQTFPSARLVQTYACTEAASSLTFYNVTDVRHARTATTHHHPAPGVCVGQSPAHVQVQLVVVAAHQPSDDQASGGHEGRTHHFVHQPYQVGLIATRGPHVMNGYWGGDQMEGRQSTDWYTTSDFGFWDEQRNLYFCGRATDTIRTGGETVWAQQVEEIILRHSAIREVAVCGLPDDRFGEAVACAVVWEDSASPPAAHPTLGEIRQWCTSQGLAGYKQPRHMTALASFPRNSSGKIVKGLLKDCFREDTPTSRL
jgi:acyl-activating enzyme 14